MYGDSLARGWHSRQHYKVEAYGGAKPQKLINAVIYGKLEEDFKAAKHLIILLGTNLLEEETNAKVINEILLAAQVVKTAYRQLTIHVGTLLPRVGVYEILQNAKIPIINQLLKKKAKKFGINICDINKALTKGGLPKGRENWNNGGLHLTKIGNTKCTHYLIEYTKKLQL